LFRIYSYYYSLGLYSAADEHFKRLKNNYPNSPYVNIAAREIPDKDEAVIEERPDINNEVTKKKETKTKPIHNFTIQAGAFSNSSNAKGLIKDFRDSGFETELMEKNVGGTTFHVVLVGKFINEEEAKSFLQVINTEFKLDGRIITLND
jgi:cell division septation protein DedD